MIGFRCLWSPPPQDLALQEDEVHVWCAGLVCTPAEQEAFFALLSFQEREHAGTFRFERHRDRYIARQGLLRLLLSRYVGVPAAQLSFIFSEHGKPALARGSGDEGLCFNTSDAGELALFAVARDREVGVDVEQVRLDEDFEAVAKSYFSPQEQSVLQGLPVERRQEAFFAAWTRKEAYLKACGKGLYLPMDAFDVSLAPDEPVRLLETRHDEREAERWSLFHLEPAVGYVGAVAVERQIARLCCWQMVVER